MSLSPEAHVWFISLGTPTSNFEMIGQHIQRSLETKWKTKTKAPHKHTHTHSPLLCSANLLVSRVPSQCQMGLEQWAGTSSKSSSAEAHYFGTYATFCISPGSAIHPVHLFNTQWKNHELPILKMWQLKACICLSLSIPHWGRFSNRMPLTPVMCPCVYVLLFFLSPTMLSISVDLRWPCCRCNSIVIWQFTSG